jgi:hypothetical protein
VAPPGAFVVGFGYRDQSTIGPAGKQSLTVYPEPVALIGVLKRAELIIAPGLIYSHRIGLSGSGLPAISGQQDAGIGTQFLVSDRPVLQQAFAFYATLPTGYPTGPVGFSAGVPTYSVSYTLALNCGGNLGLSTSQGVVVASGPDVANVIHRYVGYQPTINVSYAIAPPTTLLLEDQISAPTGPQAPTGNRALLAVQQTLSPNFVIDAEYEVNLLPAPGLNQHALGAGVTIRL